MAAGALQVPVRRDKEGRLHVEVCVGRRRVHRRCPQGATAADAKQLEAEITRALGQRRAPVVPGDPLLTDVLGDYTERHARHLRSPETARFHAYRLGQWVVGRRCSEARQVAAQVVAELRERRYADATINRSLGALKRSLRLAWEHGRTAVDHSQAVKRLPERNARTTTLTMEQVRDLASHASEPVRAAIWIALFTGCRRGEILKLQPADVGRSDLTIQAGNTKTLRTRTVPIIPPLRPWLKAIPLSITFEGLKSGFRRAREAAGMPDVTFHDLRRSTGTLLIRADVPLHQVSQLLGHSTTAVTEKVYAHLGSDQLKRSMGALTRLHRDLHRPKKKHAASR
jgi:integrase